MAASPPIISHRVTKNSCWSCRISVRRSFRFMVIPSEKLDLPRLAYIRRDKGSRASDRNREEGDRPATIGVNFRPSSMPLGRVWGPRWLAFLPPALLGPP
jgi:hypothetical protein